ncbi:MAG TPA: helix-turn-helix transcriptional regulator [Solirubrobacteraceae bacterium]|jgi:two-component system, NarL family, nitrate/nitrite response regulator NarL|nr:helix-turn-helix transcriptional regulator [Solirubrobacteraceae bacterium]
MDDPRPTDIPLSVLTPRERDVLQLAADGLSTPSIAQRLSVSRATVRTHFGNIYLKLDVRSRAGAVAKGMRLGLIS